MLEAAIGAAAQGGRVAIQRSTPTQCQWSRGPLAGPVRLRFRFLGAGASTLHEGYDSILPARERSGNRVASSGTLGYQPLNSYVTIG